MEHGLLIGLLVLTFCFIANAYHQGSLLDDHELQLKKLREALMLLERKVSDLSGSVREVQGDIGGRR